MSDRVPTVVSVQTNTLSDERCATLHTSDPTVVDAFLASGGELDTRTRALMSFCLPLVEPTSSSRPQGCCIAAQVCESAAPPAPTHVAPAAPAAAADGSALGSDPAQLTAVASDGDAVLVSPPHTSLALGTKRVFTPPLYLSRKSVSPIAVET